MACITQLQEGARATCMYTVERNVTREIEVSG